MTNRWLNLLETHVEKGILGLAAAFLLFMLWAYLIRSPNKVPYNNQDLGPRQLAEAIQRDADALEQRIRSATADDPKVDEFSENLKKQHAEGIFAAAPDRGPRLDPELRLAASYGREIEVPGLEEAEGEAGSIVLVRPLRPSEPKLRTGRSLAIRKQIQIAGLDEAAATTPPEEEETLEAKEVAWVTVAAYFNKKAQYNEMIKAGYVPYRSKAYVVGLDVQRQEVLSTGEFSQWQEVKAAKAMPKFELHEPQFDDETGELLNKNDLRQTFATVKAAQQTLMQPPFYAVDGGDFWELPALAGYEDDEEEEEEDETALAEGRLRTGGMVPPTMVPGRLGGGGGASPRGGRTGGRSIGIGGRGGGVEGGGGVRGGGSGGAARDEAERKREARKAIRTDLTEAKKLLGQKEYDQARNLAIGIVRNQYATKGDIRRAKDIQQAAERQLKLENERAEQAGRMGLFTTGGARFGSDRDGPELISHPETDEPAVWFHDDTVEAGKTYRYRMRVKLWNRYVGRMRAVKDPEQAKQTVVAGEWSFPSDPVTVTPSTYFFFSGARQPDTASVDAWKWRKGRWFKHRFDVTVGDVIGSDVKNVKTSEYDEEGDEIKETIDFTTDAVVLDLRFDEPLKARWPGKDGVFSYRDKTSPVMVYLDPADGQVKERVLVFDRRDPKKKELEDSAW